MPSQKGRGAATLKDILSEMRGHAVILEDIRSQNRATIEAVQMTRAVLEEKIDRLDRDSQQRDADLGTAIRSLRTSVEQNSADIRQNSADIGKNGEDIRSLTARVDALGAV